MISGLTYVPDFISPELANQLVTVIDSSSWNKDLKRRTQHYGWRYDYTKRRVDDSLFLGPLPAFLDLVIAQLKTLKIKKTVKSEPDQIFEPDQAIINEYLPGQGIAPHVDCVPCFGHVIAAISLLSPCLMDFRWHNSHEELWLEPRSLLTLEQQARFGWTHGIVPRFQDIINDTPIPRQRRISITFRKILKHK